MSRKVLTVTHVQLKLDKKNPPGVHIDARGTVPTPGWTDAQLIPYVYLVPPADGIYDFDFVATPPHKMVPQVITPIHASDTIDPVPGGFRGVRIHASANQKEALLLLAADVVEVRGTLVEGVECVGLQTERELYSLAGDLHGFGPGDEVIVQGTPQQISYCMQGTTLAVISIEAAPSTSPAPQPAPA